MEGNVQLLLAAEKRANEIIQSAQEEKTNKLKEARFHANQEIEKFRQQEEENFKKEIERKWGKKDDLQELEYQTQKDIDAIGKEFRTNKEQVIQLLLKNVMNVNLEIPDVVKGVFE